MKKLLRDVIATAIGITVYVGGTILVVLFVMMSVTVAQTFSAWTLIISLPIALFLFSLLIVGLNYGFENADELLPKLDKLLKIK